MATKYAGRNGLVYLGVGGAAYAMGALKEWSFDRKVDMIETTCMGDSNKTFVPGLPDMKGTFSGFWDAADDQLFTAAEQTAAVNMYIYPSSTTITKYFYGTAFVDFSLSGGKDKAVEFAGSFAAASSWARK
jgi:hypothetical protein